MSHDPEFMIMTQFRESESTKHRNFNSDKLYIENQKSLFYYVFLKEKTKLNENDFNSNFSKRILFH